MLRCHPASLGTCSCVPAPRNCQSLAPMLIYRLVVPVPWAILAELPKLAPKFQYSHKGSMAYVGGGAFGPRMAPSLPASSVGHVVSVLGSLRDAQSRGPAVLPVLLLAHAPLAPDG